MGNVRKLYLFSFFTMFLVTIPVIVPYWLSLGLDMRQVFQLQALFGLVVAVCEVPSGYACDLWGRKRTLVTGAFLTGCGFTVLLLARDFAGLAAFETITAVGMSLISGSDISLLYDSIKEQDADRGVATKAVANMSFAELVAESIASVLGGLLVLLSFRHVLWAQAVAAWVPFFVALSFREPKGLRMKGSDGHAANFRRLLTHLFRGDPLLRLIFVNLVVWGLSTFMAVWLLQKYWQEQGVPLAVFGITWAALNFSAGLVGKQVHRAEAKWGPIPLLFFLGLAPSVGYFGMAAGSGWLGVAFALFLYAARGVTQVLLRDALNWRLPSEFRATVNSLQSLCFRGGFAILGPILGFIVDRHGMRTAMWSTGSFFVVLFVVVLRPMIASVRRLAPAGIPEG